MPTISTDLEALGRELLDRSLIQVGDSQLHASVTAPFQIGAVSFTPTTKLSVHVLNDAKDKDDDAVFGKNAHLAFDLQSAWVKYKLTLKTEAAVAFELFAHEQGRAIELSDYRIHKPGERAFDVVRRDLASPRTLLDFSDVKRLQPGEALAMDLGGSITTSVSFSWSDALSTQLHALTNGLVPKGVPVRIKMKKGAEATASVKVTDQFAVVISRTTDGRYRIAVKKAKSRRNAFGIDVSIGAEAELATWLEDVAEPVLDAIEEQAPGSREVLRKDVLDRLKKIARWKASTGFEYEYARIDENSAIADFILNDVALLESDYKLAVAGDFAKVREVLLRDDGKRELVKYLNERTLTRRSSSGFSLNLGRWLDVESRDQNAFKQTTRESLEKRKLITCRGTSKFEEKQIPQNDFEWVVDLKAQMKAFSAKPVTTEFDFGLHYLVAIERAELSEEDVARMLDFARMWGVPAPAPLHFDAIVGQRGKIKVQMLLEREQLVEILARVGDVDDWAVPLAAAMPFSNVFVERRSFGQRISLYDDAWRAWLNNPQSNTMAILRPRIHSALRAFEESGKIGSFKWTTGTGQTRLRPRLDAFMRGARRLHGALTTAQDPSAIGIAYGELQQFWSHRLYVAASGRYLLDRAREAKIDIETSLQIDLAEETITS